MKIQYQVIDIIDESLSDEELKEIFNKKLYQVIQIMEANIDK